MKKLAILAVVAGTAALFSFRPAATNWKLDKAHSKLGFTITHLAVSEVEGFFKSFDASISATGVDFTDATVELTAQTASINTDNDKRDEHLKSADFFDASQFSTVTFKSTSFKKNGKNYKVKGDLTMHGVTKPVELDVVCRKGTNPMSGKEVAGFKITGKIKRSDYKLGEKFQAPMLSDEVAITGNAEFGKE